MIAPVHPDWFYLPSFTVLVPAHPGSPGQNPGGCKMVVVVAVVVVVRIMLSHWFGLVLCVSCSALTWLNDMNGVCYGQSTISVNGRKDIKPIKTHSTDSQG